MTEIPTCNLCGEKRLEALWRVPSRLTASEHPILREPATYHLDRCASCGLIQVRERERLSEAFLKALYAEDYFLDYGRKGPYEAYLTRHRPFRSLARVLDGCRGPGKRRLLEIGCGYGGFLEEAARRGWEAEGIEYSSHAAASARRRGLKVCCPGDGADDAPERDYEAVVLLATLEHVPDPKRFLAKAVRQLLPGGRLMLTTIDMEGLLPRLLGRSWGQIAPPWHLYYFNQLQVARYLEGAGLKPLFIGGKILPMTTCYRVKRYSAGRRIGNAGYLLAVASR